MSAVFPMSPLLASAIMKILCGELKEVNKPRFYDFMEYRMNPAEVKKKFKEKGWKTIVGFQTRNPMHRAHYELTKYALNKTGESNAKLFLNPVVGQTQTVDIDYSTRVHCYKAMLNKYENDSVLLSLLPLTMRMALRESSNCQLRSGVETPKKSRLALLKRTQLPSSK